ERERERKARPAALGGLDGERAALRLDQALTDRKAEADAALAAPAAGGAAEERLEDATALGLVDPGPVVADGHDGEPAVLRDLDLDRLGRRRVARRVFEEVLQHLVDP